METSPESTLQTLATNEEIVIAKKKFRVEILEDGQVFLHGSRNVVYAAHVISNVQGEDTGIRGVRAWRTDVPVLDNSLKPLRFILMGNMMEDITGMNVPMSSSK